MPTYASLIRPYVDAEILASARTEQAGLPSAAFQHLEHAHVLGQESTVQHVRVHFKMFMWGVRQRSMKECVGQLVRIVGAATKTAFGLVPSGNTGGANISPFKPLPIAPELAQTIATVRRAAGRDGAA